MSIKPTSGLNELLSNFRQAKSTSGKGSIELFQEAIKLRYGPSKNGFSEYFNYRLYDENFITAENKHTFLNSGFSHQIWEELNPTKWTGLAIDKVFFQLILQQLGFPQPKLVAFFDKSARCAPGVTMLRTASDIEKTITANDNLPLFAKPIDSYRSRGAMGIKSVDINSEMLTLANDEIKPVSQVVEEIMQWDNYVFQELLEPNPALADYSGSSLSTIRMIVLFLNDGPRLFRSVWKLPTRGNMADNFWREGNLVAHVNPDSGKVSTLIKSVDGGHRDLNRSDPLGEWLIDSSPPDFAEAKQLVLQLATVFPMFRFQAWDIALSARGPVPIELNHNGDLELLQVGAKEGLLKGDFVKLLKEQEISLEKPRTWGEWAKNQGKV